MAPTFAELAGTEIPKFVDGRSLVEILKGKTPKDWRNAFLIEHWTQGKIRGYSNNIRLQRKIAVKIGMREFGSNIPTYHALRHANSSFTEYETGEQEYYNLIDDPSQVKNLSSKIPSSKIKNESLEALKLSQSKEYN